MNFKTLMIVAVAFTLHKTALAQEDDGNPNIKEILDQASIKNKAPSEPPAPIPPDQTFDKGTGED